jgi:hypothetical protein
MRFMADELSSATGIGAGRGICGQTLKSSITCTMGTGTGTPSRAWTA